MIPTEIDWGDWKVDVDQVYTHNLYIGKSNLEMNERYLIGPVEVLSELQFIGKIPFQYYVLGFRDSVLSKNHSDVFDMASAASCFIKLLAVRAKAAIADIAEIEGELMPAAKYIAVHQEEFGADIDIYGDLSIVVDEITQLLKENK